MDHLKPLGDYQAFRAWSGRPRAWGPDGAWRTWFAGKVVDGLCEVLDEHLARFAHTNGLPAAIGCVPWLTSEAVVDRLLELAATCIVVDKTSGLPPRLLASDNGFPNVLPDLVVMAPADDGAATVLGPYSPMPQYELGPLRVLGWQEQGRKRKPLLHAKLLVLGHLGWVTYGPDDAPPLEEWQFTPDSVWWGSANWTQLSRSHLEIGCWSNDTDLAYAATAFMSDVLAFSEPVGSTCAGPEPNLVSVEFDDDAMVEVARQQWLDHLADEDDDL